MMVYVITNKALYSYCSGKLERLEKKYQYLPLNSHDWKDIKQEIMIRVFQKKEKLEDGRGFKGYLTVLIKNAFKNQMREFYCSTSKEENRFAKLNVKFPRRILTKTKEIDFVGNIENVYQPDIEESKDNISSEIKNEVEKIVKSLPEKEQKLLEFFQKNGSWIKDIENNRKQYQRNRAAGLKIIEKIKYQIYNPI